MKKLSKYFKITPIDVLIYSIKREEAEVLPDIGFAVKPKFENDKRKGYFIHDNDVFVHQTLLQDKAYLLKLIDRNGPLVSTSITNPDYRGKSIYPFVLNLAARDFFAETNCAEVFGVVNSDNASSIRGLEKAGYRMRAKIKARRFLFFYLNLDKQMV